MILVFALYSLPELKAINASPIPVRLRQPDGREVTLRIKGDSFFNWYEDMSGRTVIRDRKSYVYARLDEQGWLAPTSLLVGRDDPQAAGVRSGVFPSRQAVQTFRQREIARRVSGSGVQGISANVTPPSLVAASGTIKNLVVLCQFSDHDGTKIRAREDYDVVFNTIGGDPTLAPTGSVKDYFTETSYGTVTLNSTVVAWVTLPNTEAYYANGQHGTGSYPTNAQRMVMDALNLADPLVNFGEFDSDNDGYIDAITIIHSGYAAETGGGGGNWIWSHKWALWAVPGGQWTSADDNGAGAKVKVYDYHTEAALWSTSGTGITRIGVICHETGHFFGLPDLYDTDQSSEGIGSYCLMANSWGFDFSQRHPPHFSAWCKQQLGWVTPTVITNGTYNAPRVAETPTLFRINQGYPAGEYLLIENRQPFGFENNMPQGGLCIWHIDENKANNNAEGFPGQAGWPANGNHYKIALLQADGLYEMEKGLNRGNAGDVFHGGGVSQITPATVPNTDRYQGGTVMASNNFITNIGPAGASMAFTYQQVALPNINSALAVSAPINQPFSYQITATNSPTSYGAANLPLGLTINTTTGLISGTPQTVGVFNVGLTATNGEGPGNATLVLTLIPPVIASFNMDTDPGWTKQGEWAYGTPTGGGGTAHGEPDPTAGATGTKVYGINLAGDYSIALGGPYYLTTSAINLAAASNTVLRFKRWLNSDYQPYVYATVQVSNNGSTWTTLWQNGATTVSDSGWTEVSYDISSVADSQSTVYVRWGHQVGSTVDVWAYSGWNVDDVEILGVVTNRAPVVAAASASGDEDQTISGQLTGTDANADPLSFIRVTNAAHGVVTVQNNGSFSYVPEANYHGPDSFTYKANDGSLDSNVATVSFTVNAVNDAPEALFDWEEILEDATLSGTLTGVDVENDPLTFALVADAEHGTVTVNANGSYSYVPDLNFYGLDSFTYKTNDGQLDSGVSVMNVIVLGLNDAPTVSNVSFSGNEDTTITGQLTGMDVEDDPLTFAVVAEPLKGLVTVNTDGSFSYLPNPNFYGTDSFTYKANDQPLDSNVATVSITVNAVNDAPTVMLFRQVTIEDIVLNSNVSGSDVENSPLTFALVSQAAHGTVTMNADGTYSYQPDANFNGDDSFTFKANDGQLDSLPGTVEVFVFAENDAPVALAQSRATSDSVPLAITLAGTDVEDDPLSFVIVTEPHHGTLSGTAPEVSYVSEAGYAGADSFTFKVNDGALDSEVVTVSLTVNPVAPVITVPPVAHTKNPGERVVLSVTNTGSRPLQYLWLKDGEIIEGAEAATLVLDPLAESHEGAYQVRITNAVDTVVSEPVQVQVNDPIVFTSQPLSREVSETDEVIFSVAVTGTGPISYQWQKDGVDIPDENTSTFRIASAAKSDEGSYSVIVSNIVGDYPSEEATLAVVEGKPKIIQLTEHQLKRPGDHLHLEVSALGRPPLRYQWKFNGKNITGATQRKLSLYSTSLKSAGRYSVTVTSAEATPSTDIQVGMVENKPVPFVLATKATATLKAVAAGNLLTFTWRRVDGDMPAAPRMTLSTDRRTLSLKTLTTDDSGRYFCEVSGPGGTLAAATTDVSIFDAAPDLLVQDLPDGIVGDLYTHSVKLGGTSRHAVTKFSASGLPKGVTINSKTGLISGRPSLAKKYSVTITASNAKGSPKVTEEIEIKVFPERLAGSYTGIIPRHAGLNGDLGGRLDFTLSSLGSLSGKMILGTRSLTLKGSVDLDPAGVVLPKVTLTLARPVTGAPALHPVTLEASIDTSANKLCFTEDSRLHADTDVVNVTGWSLPWKKLGNPASAFAGFYTLALEIPQDQQNTATIPQGNGFAAFTLSTDGKTKITGKTADGTSFTCSTHLSQNADLGLFATLYGNSPTPGSIVGPFSILPGELASASDNTLAGQWTWSRPDRRPKGGSTYPAGFAPVTLDLLGGSYTRPAFHLDVTPGVDAPQLYFAAADIESSETQPDASMSIDNKNAIKIEAGKAAIVSLKSDSTKATFNGTFKLSDPHWSKPAPARWPREVDYQGIIVLLPQGYRGYGYFLLPAIPIVDPKITPPQIQSGQVMWLPNPLADD